MNATKQLIPTVLDSSDTKLKSRPLPESPSRARFIELETAVREAKRRFERAEARVLLESPDTLQSRYGMSKSKISMELMRKVAINDPEVSRLSDELTRLEGELATIRSRVATDEEMSLEDKITRSLSGVPMKQFDADAFAVYSAVLENITQASENVKDLLSRLGSPDSKDRPKAEDIHKQAVILRGTLTDYVEILRLLTLVCHSKEVIHELRAVSKNARDLRSDCSSIISTVDLTLRW